MLPVIYGRMDPDGMFRCATTQLSPLLKNQWPLHPSVWRNHLPLDILVLIWVLCQQKRIITVREAARCQGFPDSYIFTSVEDKPSKIIDDVSGSCSNIPDFSKMTYSATQTNWQCCCSAICACSGERARKSHDVGLGAEGEGGECVAVGACCRRLL